MAPIARSVACLRLSGDDLDPDEITALLGAAPSLARRRGDPRGGRRGGTSPCGQWHLEAEATEPEDLPAQVAGLLASLTPELATWQALSARYRIDLFCGWFMQDSNEGSDLPPATLLALAERGITLGLDIYAPPDDDG